MNKSEQMISFISESNQYSMEIFIGIGFSPNNYLK